MSLLPEIERELLRAARRPLDDEEGIGHEARAKHGGGRRGSVASVLLTTAVALIALAFAGLLLVLLQHRRPTSTGMVGHRARIYRDRAGWAIHVPPGWHVVPFRASRNGVTSIGAEISNVRLPTPRLVPGYAIQVNDRLLPARGIGLIIATDSYSRLPHGSLPVPPLPAPYPAGEKGWGVGSALPGSPYVETLWFRGAGKTFLASAKVGAKATARDLKAFAGIIRSLRFEPAGHAAASGFPDAPRTQTGNWRLGGPCKLASPNRYLPKLAGCVSVLRADIDGDGRPDLVLLYAQPGGLSVGLVRSSGGIRHVPDEFMPRAFTLKVVRASGGELTSRVPYSNVTPAIILVRDVNGRPGDEIFIHQTHLSSGESVGIYAFNGRRLVRATPPYFWAYGGDSGLQYGLTCNRVNPATRSLTTGLMPIPEIIQHQFTLEGPNVFGRWQRTDTTYLWIGAALRRRSQRTTQEHGLPPKRLTGIHC